MRIEREGGGSARSPASAYAAVVVAALVAGLLRLGVVDEFVVGVISGAAVPDTDWTPEGPSSAAILYRFGTWAFALTFLCGATLVAWRWRFSSRWLVSAWASGVAYLGGRLWLWASLPDDIWPPGGASRLAGVAVTLFGLGALGSLWGAMRSHLGGPHGRGPQRSEPARRAGQERVAGADEGRGDGAA